MRRTFSKLTYDLMSKNENVFLLMGDLGYKMWDSVREDFPDRAINVGAAEQLMVGAGVGLALSNKIALCYSITPFLLHRPHEWIKNYLNNQRIPVKLIGSGRNKDYSHDGFSHWSEDDRETMSKFKNIESFWPEDIDDLIQNFDKYILSPNPSYINLKR